MFHRVSPTQTISSAHLTFLAVSLGILKPVRSPAPGPEKQKDVGSYISSFEISSCHTSGSLERLDTGDGPTWGILP